VVKHPCAYGAPVGKGQRGALSVGAGGGRIEGAWATCACSLIRCLVDFSGAPHPPWRATTPMAEHPCAGARSREGLEGSTKCKRGRREDKEEWHCKELGQASVAPRLASYVSRLGGRSTGG